MKTAAANGLVLLVSLATAVLLCEAGARLFLDPADYVSVTTERDDILGIRIAPGSPGFDIWGFRNRSVPSSAAVVALGDSHTYGNNATMADSWPYVMAHDTGLSVYNLGLGGYGPNQYYQLLQTRALKLHPRWVIVGLYMGDDFENAFTMTYGKPHWSFLRQGTFSNVDADIWEAPPDNTSASATVRNWLSQHSIVYRLVVHGPMLGALKGSIQVGRAASGQDEFTTTLAVPAAHIQEAFRPRAIRDRLDQNSAPVREGMRVTMDLLQRMNDLCKESGARMAVVIIPTKEMVFADFLLQDPALHLGDVIKESVGSETQARARLFEFLDNAGIPRIDTLDALRRDVSNQLYTHSDRDMHPGRNGYHVIGDTVAHFLESADRQARHHQ
ncbi:MAG TPA: hypothetical protein VKC35_13745 [Vicinamibacterales bacterium]|nr:hypothetical protein [Vicinamibacterales bacterium]